MIPGLSPIEERNLILSVGTHRAARPLSPIEVGLLLRRANQAGASVSELAAACHLEGGTWITRFMRLVDLSPAVHHLVDWGNAKGSLSMTQAQEIARIRSGRDQEVIVGRAIEKRMNSHEVRQAVQLLHRSDMTPEQAVDSVLDLRPEVVRQFVYVARIIDEVMRERLGQRTQAERNQLLAEALEPLKLGRIDSRLGVDRFTLTASEEVAKGIDVDRVEATVNSFLAATLSEA